MIKVNLVPADILAKAQQKQRAMQAGAAAGAVAAIIVAVSLVFVARLHRLEKKIARQKDEAQKLSVIVAKVKQAESDKEQLNKRLAAIDGLAQGRRAYPYFMNDFVRNVPAGVRVQTMGTAGGAGSPFKLNIAAEARTSEDIALWIHKMEGTGRFSAIELGPVTTKEASGLQLRGFTLTTVYTPQL